METQTSFLHNPVHKKAEFQPVEIFVDGASRGNPGPAGAGIFITQADTELFKSGFFLGKKTNNQAEYLALTLAVFLLKKQIKNPEKIIITSDSELLIKQMRGEYKVKNPILFQIKNLIHSMLTDCDCKYKHVLREKNKIADQLANKGIDLKQKMPAPFITLLKNSGIKI
jgi:ribonuclease HI